MRLVELQARASDAGLFESLDDIQFLVAASVRVAVPAAVGGDYRRIEKLDADRIGRDERLPRLASASDDVQSLDRDWRFSAARARRRGNVRQRSTAADYRQCRGADMGRGCPPSMG